MTAQTPYPTIIFAPTGVAIRNNCATLLRMPATPTEERSLGARAIIISSPNLTAQTGRALAEEALNSFDSSDGASTSERARNIITKLRGTLGEESEICMAGMLSREAWAATTSGISAAALVLRETRRVTIAFPSGAPGAKALSATRQGVTVGRLPLSEGDRIALAETAEGAVALLKVAAGGDRDDGQLGVVLALQAPAASAPQRAERREETLFAIPVDNIAQAKARARARWEEGNDERSEQIAATVPPKPTGDPRRPEGVMAPYTPIDRAAQEVIAERRGGGVRASAAPRGVEPRPERPSREGRLRDATRKAAKARAERSAGAEPRTERSWAEKAATAPSPIQRAAARFVAKLEARFPWLATQEVPPTLDPEQLAKRDPAEDGATRSRRLAASALLAAVLIAALGGGAAVYLNQANPNLDDAASARIAMNEARRAVEEALNPTTNLLANDPDRARKLLIAATESLNIAEAGGTPAAETAALRSQMSPALNRLFLLKDVTVMEVFDFSSASVPIAITAITQGPDGFSYIIDDYSGAVYRVDPGAQPNPRATVVFQPGYDLYGSRTGRAQAIMSSGPDLVIFDASSNLWRWRPADTSGKGTLVKLRVRDGELWGSDVKIISGFAADEGTGLYRLYAVDPSARQILRYAPAPDGTGYPAQPTGYLINPTSLASVEGLVIDGDLYLSQDGAIRRYVGGAVDEWAPADPGDGALRSAPQASFIFSVGPSRTGVIYAWDSKNQRMLAYSKGGTGSVLAQYGFPSANTPAVNIVGGFISPAADGGAPTFVWAEGARIRSAVLGTGVTPGSDPTVAPTAAPVIELPSTQP